MSTIILQGQHLDSMSAQSIASQLNGKLEDASNFCKLTTTRPIDTKALLPLRERYRFDINLLPQGFDGHQIKLLIMDMDSTLINIECIDEIADFINVKSEVAKITEAAMRGELDFESSLTQRVRLLTGLNTQALEHVYNERLQLNPGAEKLIGTLRKRGIKVALVSGGFTFFTQRLQERLDLDFTLANVLDIKNGNLTGKVVGKIIGAESKAQFLKTLVRKLGISTQQTIAVGDGANDLKMMAIAGLSVAYHAKPAVQAQAATALNYNGLDAILSLMDIETKRYN